MSALFRPRGLMLGPSMVPTEPIELDLGHELAQGLSIAYFPGTMLGLRDATGRQAPFAPLSNGTIAGTQRGSASWVSGTGNLSLSTPGTLAAELVSGAGVSLFAFFNQPTAQFNSSAMYGMVYGNGGPSPYTILSLSGGNNAVKETLIFNTGGTYNSGGTGTGYLSLGLQNFVGVFTFGGNVTSYVNGALVSTVTGPFSAPTYSTSHNIVMGGGGGSSANYNPYTYAFCMYRRPLSVGDIAWLAAEPFAMLVPIQRRTWVFLGGGGNIYNETISESGSAIDTLTAVLIANPTLTEAGSASDSIAAAATFTPALTESRRGI